jgi:O-antigen ligase
MSSVEIVDSRLAAKVAGCVRRLAAVELFPVAVRAVLFLAFFGNSLDLESDLDPKVGLNLQAIAKAALMVMAGVLGGMGWWRLPEVRQLQQTGIGRCSLCLAALYFASVPTSIDLPVSLVGAIAFPSYLLLLLTALVLHGPFRILYDAFAALGCYLLIAWLLYWWMPELGVYMEATGVQGLEIARMHGMGHPNALGRSASIFALICLAGYRQRHFSWPLAAWGVVFGWVTIWASLSRTALVACLLSILVFHRALFRHRWVLVGFGPLCLLVVAGLIFIDSYYGLEQVTTRVLTNASKTGDADEIFSVTGRTEIWAYSWQLIKDRPWLGYGSGTSPLLLQDYSHQTHNILLNPMLSLGVGGGMIVGLWLLLNAVWALKTEVHAVSAICIFILISGVTENTILPTYPETCTLAWLLISFWPYLRGHSPRAVGGEVGNRLLGDDPQS